MKDPRLAAALLESSPDALAELFDAYGDRLFRYCWSLLRSRSQAQVALRDTLLVAQAHIARLADPEDPESLGPWLYSLARAECGRHCAVPAAGADESPARRERMRVDPDAGSHPSGSIRRDRPSKTASSRTPTESSSSSACS